MYFILNMFTLKLLVTSYSCPVQKELIFPSPSIQTFFLPNREITENIKSRNTLPDILHPENMKSRLLPRNILQQLFSTINQIHLALKIKKDFATTSSYTLTFHSLPSLHTVARVQSLRGTRDPGILRVSPDVYSVPTESVDRWF